MRALKVYEHVMEDIRGGIQDDARQLDDGRNAFGLTDQPVTDPRLLAMPLAHTREDVAMQAGASGIMTWQNTMISRGIWPLPLVACLGATGGCPKTLRLS